MLKAAQCMIVPRFPFFAFCPAKYCQLEHLTMVLNVCLNKMAPFVAFATLIRGSSTYDRDVRNAGQATSKYD